MSFQKIDRHYYESKGMLLTQSIRPMPRLVRNILETLDLTLEKARYDAKGMLLDGQEVDLDVVIPLLDYIDGLVYVLHDWITLSSQKDLANLTTGELVSLLGTWLDAMISKENHRIDVLHAFMTSKAATSLEKFLETYVFGE